MTKATTKKRYKIQWFCMGGYKIKEENPLTQEEIEKRKKQHNV